MKVILFGASGMVGQGVLRECLLDPEVERVLVLGRSTIGRMSRVEFPRLVTTTERVGRAMLHVTKRGNPMPLVEHADINRLGSAN